MKLKLFYILGILFMAETLLSLTKLNDGEVTEICTVPSPVIPEPQETEEGGPSQPEVQSFTPADVTNMVNLFTGDFSYNIPLMDVGGYPINIAYSQGAGMEEDASCVGFGWNLSVGSINHIVRGLPDDFSGDEIEYEHYQKPNITFGFVPEIATEIFGFGIAMGATLRHNNYTGIGTDLSVGASYSRKMHNGFKGQLGCTLGLNSDTGPYYSPNISMGYGSDKNNIGVNFGYKASSFEGLESISFSGQIKHGKLGYLNNYSKISGSHSFNSITSLAPSRNCAMINRGFTGKVRVGGEAQGFTIQTGTSFFYSEQLIAMNEKKTPAYGYMFSQKAGHGGALLDFQRDEETGADDKVPNLPATAFTYDLFQVNGQGLSGQFRAYRNDVGILHDPFIESGAQPNVNIGMEAEIGSLVGLGLDVGLAIAQNQSGEWIETNGITALASFTDTTSGDPEYKPFYFKEVGESTPFDNDIYHAAVDTAAVRLEVSLGELHPEFNYGLNYRKPINRALINHKIPRRNTLFSYLDATEAASVALEKRIANYPLASISRPFPLPTFESREFSFRRKHHISEITITKDDGIRYIYGIPAYNIDKKEVSFNISGAIDNISENLIKYVGSYVTHKNNTNGLNHSFSSTKTPGYTYAYLLTDIVSPDYVDRTADGPSPDDNGTYTKFNYHKANSNYRWRMPYLKNSAHYQSNTNNLHTQSDGDDIASFMYGEKEVWYNQSVETKNYVALFYYSPRSDARGVLDEDGGIDRANADQQLLKLDSISLFTRVSPGIPIQTVHFEYDYSLCKGTPTNDENYSPLGFNISPILDYDTTRGKLTLKRIYFTYQNSEKGKLIRYTFAYQNNQNYNDAKNDRWGNYKDYKGDFTGIPNKDFPYVQQKRKSIADNEAAAWCLSRITTTTNSTIDIEYESDDYAYVQDKPAMQMVKVLGFGRYSDVSGNGTRSINRDNITRIPTDPHVGPTIAAEAPTLVKHDVIYFRFPMRNATNPDYQSMLEQMTLGVDELFFNMSTKIGNLNEDVTGFIKTQDHARGHGLALLDGETIGWIITPYQEYRPDQPELSEYHPVTLAAFRYALENLPRIAKGNTEPLPETGDYSLLEFADRFGDMFQMLGSNQNDWMFDNAIGNLIDTSQSYIRLNNPYRCKYGGGARVKQITISDNWDDMSEGPSKNYGVEYDYTILEDGEKISSGVATYEPESGNDENPVYQPVRVGDYDDPKYRRVVAPIGRSLFPAANVGYAKVTVRSLQEKTIQRTATGKTEHEFYTARDFPVLVNSTNPQMNTNTDSPGEQFANAVTSMFWSEDQLTVSQGHVVQLNDMPGKPKSVSVYAEGSDYPISGSSYIYKTKANNPKILKNQVDFIAPDGSVRSGLAAMESDFVVDTRYSWDRTWTHSIANNVNIVLYPVVPVFVPVPMASYHGTLVHVVSTTKVIHQTGIIDSVIVFDNGARVTTKNIAYDSETGHVLLTETANEFKDKYYSLTVPAHWVESGMGHAGFNQGNEYQITNYTSGNGFATIHGPDGIRLDSLFYKGDEVFLKSSPWRDRLWIVSVESRRIQLIDRNGNYPLLTGPFTNTSLKVIRSGKRNMQSIPVGSITMQENPIVGVTSALRHLTENWNRVVNASATRYVDNWQAYKIQRVALPTDQCVCDENKNGLRVVQQILAWVASSNGPETFNFSNLTVSPGIISDAEKLFYFGSGPLEISASTFGNCVEIRLNRTCTFTLCSRDAQALTGSIQSITSIASVAQNDDAANEGCPDQYLFTAEINFGGTGITYVSNSERTAQVFGQSSCIPLYSCRTNPSAYHNSACDAVTGITINPYVEGIRGNYRPLGEYVFAIGERTPSSTAEPLPLRESGFYNDQFRPFWDCTAFHGADPRLWKTSSTLSKIDPNGRALETKDAIGVYSADLYGFNQNLVVASAQNATYNQIAFESFEDFDYPVGIASGGCPSLKHWPLFLIADSPTKSAGGVIDNSMSHTGKNSLRLIPGSSHAVNVSLLPTADSRDTDPKVLRLADLTGYFKPTPGEYYISAWLKKDIDLYNDAIYDTYRTANVSVNGVELDNRTNIIDGWQQVWGTITITEGQSQLSFQLIAGTTFTNFDDIRIQPVNASMKTYVYRPDNLRLCAELDENNFATLYEYDEEGALTRTKKETERGVMTLQEVRFANPKSR